MKTKKHFLLILIIAIAAMLILSVNFIFGGDVAQYDIDKYSKYKNNSYGYEIVLLNNLILYEDIANIKSRFESQNLVVDIFYDNFEGTLDSTATYNNYGNEGIKRNSNFKVTKEFEQKLGGQNAHIILYERRKLHKDKPDRNYYATLAFSRTSKEIVTVFIKSSTPIDIKYVMPSFKFIPKTGEKKEFKVFGPVKKKFNPKTQEFCDKYFTNNEKLDFGIFEPTFPMTTDRLKQMESLFDYNFPVTLMYNSFVLPFKTDYMNNAKKMSKVIEYTLYTTDISDNIENDITLDIIEGKYDKYLEDLAKSFNAYDYPILFRLNNEMNGAWVLYSSYSVGKDTDLYIECWRYIYNKFKDNGVDNLIFVWNPNEQSFPGYSYNNYLNYYPGNEYVDIVGLTAYNTGNYYPGETWRSFSESYDCFYYDYAEHFKHPFMITEFSCSSTGGNKSQWFDDMFNVIQKYDRIKLAVLWNGQDFDTEKPEKTISRNYRLDLEESVINSVRMGLKKFK